MLKKLNKIQIIHILLIAIGSIFMLSGAFHSNIWFDEAYTVGLVNHSFLDIINIGIHDVHPLFYYLFLKLFTIITVWTSNITVNIIAMRIFSIIGMITLSILGYTHIRKDFGEKTGLIFSFLISFLPVTLLYSNEIRMYSWAAVFVLLTAIYAYRITKENSVKNWILFSIFSLLSAYTHYFAMMSIGLINLALFIYVLKKLKKEKIFKKWIISAVTQVTLFIPGLIVFVLQATRVAKGFWIKITYPDVFIDILKFNFLGEVTSKGLSTFILVFASALFVYIIVKTILEYKKDNKKVIPVILSVIIYIGVIAAALILSTVSDIFTTRYTIPMLGLLCIYISYILSLSNKKITLVICTIILALSINNSIIFFNKNYDERNYDLRNTINENIKEDDIFIYSDINSGSIVAEYMPRNKQYFYNIEHWTVEEAYKAFAPQMQTIEGLNVIENYKGRIWVIDGDNTRMYDIITEYDDIDIIREPTKVNAPYKNITWTVSLVEKM